MSDAAQHAASANSVRRLPVELAGGEVLGPQLAGTRPAVIVPSASCWYALRSSWSAFSFGIRVEQLPALGGDRRRPACRMPSFLSRSSTLGVTAGLLRQREVVDARHPSRSADCSFSSVVLPSCAGQLRHFLVEVGVELVDGDDAVRLVAVRVGRALEAVEQHLGEQAVAFAGRAAARRRCSDSMTTRPGGRVCSSLSSLPTNTRSRSHEVRVGNDFLAGVDTLEVHVEDRARASGS